MFIPRYWSEARHRELLPARRQVTVCRFGWSSNSQEEADAHARQRLEEALAVLRDRGEGALRDFTRRERVVAYSGADGLPIREEIVHEYPALDVVVTRNGYGALCLNTTQAMFVDVDRAEPAAGLPGCLGALVGALVGGVAAAVLGEMFALPGGVVTGVFALAILGYYAGKLVGRVASARGGPGSAPLSWTKSRVEAWCASRPEWRVAVYETPAGVRLLPLHACFDAAEESPFEFMAFVRADPLYVRMCRLQRCFRARVSPKPWRAGIEDHFKTGGTWPVRDSRKLAVRAEWVRRYEQKASRFASCRLVEVVGDGATDPRVDAIRRRHDELCRVGSGRELA